MKMTMQGKKNSTRKNRLILALAMIATGFQTWAHEPTPRPDINEHFALHSVCDGEANHLYLEQKDGNLHIELGTISRGKMLPKVGAVLLGKESLSALANQFTSNVLLLTEMALCGTDEPPVIEPFGIDIGIGTEDPSEAKPGASVCYPLEHCTWFDAACGFFGGTLKEFDYPSPHHICLS